jgi:hypothetical protein
MNALATNRLNEIAETVKAEHAQFESALRESMARAVKIGALLTEAKELVKHGEWGKWLEDHCTFSERTAQNYMRIYNKYPQLVQSATVADLTYREAITLLAEPKQETSDKTEFSSFPLEDVQPDGLTAEVRSLRQRAYKQAREDVPGTLQARNHQNIANIEMQRACGKWINNLEERFSKEQARLICTYAGRVVDYSMYAAAYRLCSDGATPEPPKRLEFLRDMEFVELMDLGEDCLTALTVNHEKICKMPERARVAFHSDPVAYLKAVGMADICERIDANSGQPLEGRR